LKAYHKGVCPLYLKNHQLEEIMKFILLQIEHPLLLLLPIKIKQPSIDHLSNLKNLKSQYEEELIHAKYQKYHPIN